MQADRLFPDRKHDGVRVVLTGQVGLDKRDFAEHTARIARSMGQEVTVFNVGERMYKEAPDVVPGRILDLPKKRLDTLRRSVFKDILAAAAKGENIIVNTHATFRWRHGLFQAFDHDQLAALDADLYVTLADNVDSVHLRLQREHSVRHTLKDILVWREEEIVVTETIAEALRGHEAHYIISRGVESDSANMLYRLMFEPHRKRIYPSFPMTHVMDLPDVLEEIDSFRAAINEHFITFDPGDLDEKRLLFEAGAATQRGELEFSVEVLGQPLTLNVQAVTQVAGDIDGQIYARDFKLIDQSDMIVSFIPQMPDGKPGLSSGVERELQHAFEGTKEVYVIWTPKMEPSPFITETATRVFPSVDALMGYFQDKNYMGDYQLSLTQGKRAT